MLEILPAITTLGRGKQRKFKGSVSSRPAEMNEIGQTAISLDCLRRLRGLWQAPWISSSDLSPENSPPFLLPEELNSPNLRCFGAKVVIFFCMKILLSSNNQ